MSHSTSSAPSVRISPDSTASLASLAADVPSQPHSHAHSYAAAAVAVPIIAHRIALPSQLQSIPLLSLLDDDDAASYSDPSALLRDPLSVAALNLTHPLAPPRVSGSRTEFIRLLARMKAVGMIDFTTAPRAVNGLFAVVKDSDADRLIIDAQPANRLFVDPPHVLLPNPSHLVQLHAERGVKLYPAKSDLSNFYHNMLLPVEWRPYFALPQITAEECAELGVPYTGLPVYPMCTTLPMGFSHAVVLAQRAHENVLYRHDTASGFGPALLRSDNLLCMDSPTIDRCIHGIYIDDLFFLSPRFEDVDAQYRRSLAAYERAGLPDSVKKRKPPLRSPKSIKAIGIEMDPIALTLSVAVADRLKLVRATLALLSAPHVTGLQLSQLIGSWTWCILLRRSALCVLQHVYRFISMAGVSPKPLRLWPSVRRELQCLLCLVPLLHSEMGSHFFEFAYASDASTIAAGVVAAPLTQRLSTALYPLSSNRRFNLLPLHRLDTESASSMEMPPAFVEHVHGLIAELRPQLAAPKWSVLIASRWRHEHHINVLELHAALLSLRHALSFPDSASSRIFTLVDSAVAYYSLWKGRSSSQQLLPALRQINAHLLVSGASLQPCWIPSEWNPADAPSRLRAFPTSVAATSSSSSSSISEPSPRL